MIDKDIIEIAEERNNVYINPDTMMYNRDSREATYGWDAVPKYWIESIKIEEHIEESGGFNNWRKWNREEVAEWVQTNYDCDDETAKEVAFYIS